MSRKASCSRATKETKIDLTIDLDGACDTDDALDVDSFKVSAMSHQMSDTSAAHGMPGVSAVPGHSAVPGISTGIPFFDHMLAQLARHSGFFLTVEAEGDLEVDSHHTVEDVGIVLGQAFRYALGDKKGIQRFASVTVPLDEAAVEIVLDLSGRPFLYFDVDFPMAPIFGTPPFDPQLTEEFWRAFTVSAGVTLHVIKCRGRNTHHIVEAMFKGVAQALRAAVRVEGGSLPSTKGTL